jgi:hypothetical protein
MKISRLVDTPKQVREGDFWRVKCQELLGLLFNKIRHAVSSCSHLVCTEVINGTRMYGKNFWIELAKPTSLPYGQVPHYTSIALVKFRVASGLAYNLLTTRSSVLLEKLRWSRNSPLLWNPCAREHTTSLYPGPDQYSPRPRPVY